MATAEQGRPGEGRLARFFGWWVSWHGLAILWVVTCVGIVLMCHCRDWDPTLWALLRKPPPPRWLITVSSVLHWVGYVLTWLGIMGAVMVIRSLILRRARTVDVHVPELLFYLAGGTAYSFSACHLAFWLMKRFPGVGLP